MPAKLRRGSDCPAFSASCNKSVTLLSHKRSSMPLIPCGAVIGEYGDLDGLTVIQAKGFPYTIANCWAPNNE